MKTIRWMVALFLLMNQVGSMVVAVNEVPWLWSEISLVQKRKDLPLVKKCEAVESIKELVQQKGTLPVEYRFILLDEEYETLQEQCNENMLILHGEVVSDEQSDLSIDNSSFLAPAVLRDSSEGTGGYSDENINEGENVNPALSEENIDPEDTATLEDLEELPEEIAELPNNENEEAIDEPLLEPMLVVISWNITIDIPSYDSAVGRSAWPTDTKEAIVNVNFWAGGTDKRVRIELAEGFRFVTYPVLVVTNNDVEVLASSELSIVLSGVTHKPVKQVYYPSINSGYLEYQFNPSTVNAQITRLSFTVDEFVYYGSTGVLANAIKVTALKDWAVINQATLDVKQTLWNISVGFGLNTNNVWVMQTVSGDSTPFPVPYTYTVRNGTFRPLSFYTKKQTIYYYYPKEATVVTTDAPSYTIDTASGVVIMTKNNAVSDFGVNLSLSASWVGVGQYTAQSKLRAEYEMYDGTIRVVTGVGPLKMEVLDPATVTNKVSLTVNNRYYTPNLGSDFDVLWPSFDIYNDQPFPKTNQVVEYSIATWYEVIQANFLVHNAKKPTKIEWRTQSWLTGTATSNQILLVSTFNYLHIYGISRSSLWLASGEYLSYAKAFIGDIKENVFANSERSHYWQGMWVIGRLSSGVNSAKVTVSTWSDAGNGSKEAGSENSVVGTVTKPASPTTLVWWQLVGADNIVFNVTAGTKKNINLKIGVGVTSSLAYANITAYTNPTIYIRKPTGVTVDTSSLVVTQNGVNLPFTVSGYTTTQGAEVIAITVSAKIGYYFDGVVKPNIDLFFDVIPDLNTVGTVVRQDHIFITTAQGGPYKPSRQQLGPVADIYDVNNNKDIAEEVMRVNTSAMNILENKNLIIDTYIQPVGAGRQPPYDTTRPDTAVNFKLWTHANYEVVFTNQRDDTATFLTYVPVPKANNNFWTNFQSTGFLWNMKLWGTPTLLILDASGTDVTAARSWNYDVTYTTAATNESNYASSPYSSAYQSNATMIKVENTVGMQPGEQALLTFDYIVDEDEVSVASAPEKLWAINDFRPYYYFQAGSAARTYGTRVGAILQIGRIGWILFSDTNADGVYNGLDLLLSNKTVALYKKGLGETYTFIASGQTASNGSYLFTGLSNGNYKVDFNQATTSATPYFTLKGNDSDPGKNSRVEYVGTSQGVVFNIDPTTENAKYVNAGILAYTPSDPTNGLKAQLNKTVTTLTITTAGTNPTEQLTTTVLPTFFNQIKDPATPIQRTSSNPAVVSVIGTQTGATLEGKTHGTGTITFTIKDVYGNTAQATVTVTVQNKIALSCTTTYSPNTNTNQNVIATLTGCNKSITVTNNGGNTNYTFTNTGSFTFTYQDSYGNTGSTTANVNWIDKSPVTGSITYSPNTATSGNVQAEISFNKTGVTVISWVPSLSGGALRSGGVIALFSGDGNFTFTYQDSYGNTGATTAMVNWIDKTPPIATTISYDPSSNTNADVFSTLTISEPIRRPTGRNGGPTGTFFTRIYTGNIDTTLTFYDLVGNSGSTGIMIDRIDKTPVTGSITYNPNTATSGNVQATISFNKTGVTVTNGIPSLPGGALRSGGVVATLTDNISFTFAYQDSYGNIGATPATVSWIDKIPPVATNISYAPNTNTNTDVGVTLTISEPVSRPTGRNGNTTGTVFTKTYTANATGTVTFYDLVGNSGSTGININRIDKSPVVGSIAYSPSTATSWDVQASITFNKPNVTITNANSAPCQGGTGEVIGGTCTFTGNGSFTFTYIDNYGNTGSTTATVNRIDKIPPRVVDLQYSPRTTTRGTVEVTITLSESGTIITNGRTPTDCTDDGVGTFHQNVLSGFTAAICWQKSFAINANETVIFYDLVGNKSTAPVSITQIVTGWGGGSIGWGWWNTGWGWDNDWEWNDDWNNTSDEEISHINDKGSSSVENNDNTHGTSEVPTPDNEIEFSYTWAHQYDITTQSSLQEANPNGVLIRAHLAKMIVNYLSNALDRQPDLTKDCSAFESSIQNETLEMQKYMKLACQYGIMGIHTDGTALSDFMPRKTVSRAEFGTVLSRILWGDTYNDAKPYYVKHLQALKNSGIMTQIDNPEKRLELRKWVWVMLMRSVEGERPASQVDKARLVPTANEIATLVPTANEITTLSSIETSPSTWPLTRGHLAKMVVDYAVNTLWKMLPEKILAWCYRKDASKAWENAEMKDYAIKACKLGLMGRDMEYFQPYTKITQDQLAIILYRLLYDANYVGRKEPRKMPLETLIADGILEPVANPKEYIITEAVATSILMKG